MGAITRGDVRAVSKAVAPPSLVVCSESRKIGLKRYRRLSFQGSCADDTFITWDRDVVLLHASHDWLFLRKLLQDYRSGYDTPIKEGKDTDSAAVMAENNSLIQQINRRARKVAIHHNDIEEMLNFTKDHPSLLLLPAAKHFMVISAISTPAGNKVGKISLAIKYPET